MLYLSRHDAWQILESRVPALLAALRYAVAVWNYDFGLHHADFDQTARGTIIGQKWLAEVERELFEDPGITVIRNGLRRCLLVDRVLILRIKHVGENSRPWNHDTERATAWDSQLPFPSIPPVPRLDFVYQMDVTGTIVVDVGVRFYQDGRVRWEWSLESAGAAVQTADMFEIEGAGFEDTLRERP